MQYDDWGTRDARWAGIRSDHVSVVGHPVRVLRADPDSVRGRGDDGTGPATTARTGSDLPILLVHGLGGSSTNWLEVMAGLAATTPVVAVDLPGFADTEPPVPRAARMRPQVHFLRHLVEALGWNRIELHGNSMGGLLSVLLAGDQPDLVGRLVLVAAAFPSARGATFSGLQHDVLRQFLPFMASRRLGLAVLHAFYDDATPEQVFTSTESLVMGEATTMRPALRQVGIEHAVNALQRPWRAESLSHATSDLLAQLSVRRREVHAAAEAITADTLWVWGDRDRLVRRGSVDALANRIPRLTGHELAGVGHVPMIEAPDAYLETVRTWQADLRQSAVGVT